MKVFFIEWSEKFHELLCHELKKQGWDILIWTGDSRSGVDPKELKNAFKDLTFLETETLIRGELNAPPPSQALIESMRYYESLALQMFDRFQYGARLCFSERIDIYLKILAYWNEQLEKNKPDAVYFSITPHMAYDFVIYGLCQIKKIPTGFFSYTRLPGRIVWMHDHREISFGLSHSTATLETLPNEIQIYLKKYLDEPKIKSQYYMKKYKTPGWKLVLERSLKALKQKRFLKGFLEELKLKVLPGRLSSIRKLSLLEYYLEPLKWRIKKIRLKHEYRSLMQPFPVESQYVYFPLHYQPERTTLPIGDFFVDQIYVAETLTQALPSNWKLVIKEHPRQLHFSGTRAHQGRFLGFYKELIKLPNTVLVPINTTESELILNAKAIATVSGTAGWEAMLKGIPVLVFGHSWFKHAPHVSSVKSVSDCKQAFNQIQKLTTQELTPKVLQPKIIGFVSELTKASQKGYVDLALENETQFSSQDCVKSLLQVFLNEPQARQKS